MKNKIPTFDEFILFEESVIKKIALNTNWNEEQKKVAKNLEHFETYTDKQIRSEAVFLNNSTPDALKSVFKYLKHSLKTFKQDIKDDFYSDDEEYTNLIKRYIKAMERVIKIYKTI